MIIGLLEKKGRYYSAFAGAFHPPARRPALLKHLHVLILANPGERPLRADN
jgi:hypothetical protein